MVCSALPRVTNVVRRIGGTTSTGRGGYEIYVDHTEDPGLEGIVLVKKKELRFDLDAVVWGQSEESTGNVQQPKSWDKEDSMRARPVEHLLKPKSDESQRWWSIGRGRKDSKEQKEPRRSKRKHRPPFSHSTMGA